MSALEMVGAAARYALGVVRVVTGTLGLVAPALVAGRLGDDAPASNPAAIYGLRLFGIRTLLLGVDLLHLRGTALDHALRSAPIIHASDLATVLALTRRGQLSPELGRPLALISGANTALAVAAFLAAPRERP